MWTIHQQRRTIIHVSSLWGYQGAVPEHFQWDISAAAPRYSISEWLWPWPRCSALSYANAGLTSAVRSKRGRGTLEPICPHSGSHTLLYSDISLSESTHTHTHTHTVRHSALRRSTSCVPVRNYSASPCWILLAHQADTDSLDSLKDIPTSWDWTFWMRVSFYWTVETERRGKKGEVQLEFGWDSTQAAGLALGFTHMWYV